MNHDYIEANSECYSILDLILKSFSRFYFLKFEDFHILFCSKNKEIIQLRIIPKLYRTLIPNKKFIIIINKNYWDYMKYNNKVNIIFKELLHIEHTNKNDYRLLKHDVQEFREILNTFGLNNENENILIDQLKNSNSFKIKNS